MCDDGGQPSTEVPNAAAVGAAEPQPGFLNGILRIIQQAEYTVGHRPKMRPVPFKPFCQPLVLAHSHNHSLQFIIIVTNETQPM
jgi:hypothetical protein